MAALTVTTDEASRSQNCVAEIRQIMQEGATAGGSTVVNAIMAIGDFDAKFNPADPSEKAKLPDLVEAIALAVVREIARRPVRLPSYTVASLPAASTLAGALVYVSNGATGAPIVAFSDGSTWLRVDNRAAVSAI